VVLKNVDSLNSPVKLPARQISSLHVIDELAYYDKRVPNHLLLLAVASLTHLQDTFILKSTDLLTNSTDSHSPVAEHKRSTPLEAKPIPSQINSLHIRTNIFLRIFSTWILFWVVTPGGVTSNCQVLSLTTKNVHEDDDGGSTHH
jgi:hypothetical protein